MGFSILRQKTKPPWSAGQAVHHPLALGFYPGSKMPLFLQRGVFQQEREGIFPGSHACGSLGGHHQALRITKEGPWRGCPVSGCFFGATNQLPNYDRDLLLVLNAQPSLGTFLTSSNLNEPVSLYLLPGSYYLCFFCVSYFYCFSMSGLASCPWASSPFSPPSSLLLLFLFPPFLEPTYFSIYSLCQVALPTPLLPSYWPFSSLLDRSGILGRQDETNAAHLCRINSNITLFNRWSINKSNTP
ncbi:hypothetical protein LEMLEM_LOCUS20072, partial [Lemmus lemmus]